MNCFWHGGKKQKGNKIACLINGIYFFYENYNNNNKRLTLPRYFMCPLLFTLHGISICVLYCNMQQLLMVLTRIHTHTLTFACTLCFSNCSNSIHLVWLGLAWLLHINMLHVSILFVCLFALS